VREAPVSAVVVASYEDPFVILRAIDGLARQTTPPHEIILIDNHPDGVVAAVVEREAPETRIIRTGKNLGYPSACNVAARAASARHMFFLNPDSDADPDCLELLVEEIERDPRHAIVGAQILLPDGETTNAGDNPLHLSGLSWAGGWGEPREHALPRDVLVASGAALLVRRDAFLQLGGYAEGFFMYYDDVDLGWRANLAGLGVRFVPEACVRHDYEFDKGTRKWRYLERNRYWSLAANYEATTLIALVPLLVAVEGAVWVLAFRRGFAREKARSWISLLRALPALIVWRRAVQRSRVVADRQLLLRMAAGIDSPALASPVWRAVAPWLVRYQRLLGHVLSAHSGPAAHASDDAHR
jgi:GT2 family glycosyltransferase